MTKRAAIGLLFILVFFVGYALGHFHYERAYKRSAVVEDALNELPEGLQVSVISGSDVARKYPHVEIGNLTTFYSTNANK